MKSIIIWKLISKSLAQKIPVMLLYVLESAGSSPGRQGFCMAVNARDEMEGSIGGGMMEHKFVETVRERLRSGDPGPGLADIKKQIHDKSAARNQSGMICSGEQTLFLYAVVATDKPVIDQIIRSLEKNENGTLLLFPKGIFFDSSIPTVDYEYKFTTEEDWSYKEKTGYKNQLFIIGGGHCSLALSRLMRTMDFFIRVYDDRSELKTMMENEAAHEKHFIKDYSELNELIAPGQNNYIVIMTFGYRTDDTALRALLSKNFKFMGMLGSTTKVEKLFEQYKKEGLGSEAIQHIHTPVGLSIKSHTPEEIAVSIAAQIIAIKNA